MLLKAIAADWIMNLLCFIFLQQLERMRVPVILSYYVTFSYNIKLVLGNKRIQFLFTYEKNCFLATIYLLYEICPQTTHISSTLWPISGASINISSIHYTQTHTRTQIILPFTFHPFYRLSFPSIYTAIFGRIVTLFHSGLMTGLTSFLFWVNVHCNSESTSQYPVVEEVTLELWSKEHRSLPVFPRFNYLIT